MVRGIERFDSSEPSPSFDLWNFSKGQGAQQRGESAESNPFKLQSKDGKSWAAGWADADMGNLCDGCSVNEPWEHRCHSADGAGVITVRGEN